MLSRNEALWPRTDRRKKGKIKYPCSRGIQSHSYKVVGNVSGMFRSSCSCRGDASHFRALSNHVGFSFNLLPVSISMGAMLVLTVLMKV